MANTQATPTELAIRPAMIEVIVGSEQQIFKFPEAVLCNASQFFKSTFQGTFRQASERKTFLPKECPELFSYLARWINGEGTMLSEETCRSIDLQTGPQLFNDLLNLYYTSEYYIIPDLCLDILERMGWIAETALEGKWLPVLLPYHLILEVWSKTTKKSSLRKRMLLLVSEMFQRVDDFTSKQALTPFKEAYVQIPEFGIACLWEMRWHVMSVAASVPPLLPLPAAVELTRRYRELRDLLFRRIQILKQRIYEIEIRMVFDHTVARRAQGHNDLSDLNLGWLAKCNWIVHHRSATQP